MLKNAQLFAESDVTFSVVNVLWDNVKMGNGDPIVIKIVKKVVKMVNVMLKMEHAHV